KFLSWFLCLFQAEDGIRDRNVTGVQTCALPIYNRMVDRVFSGRHALDMENREVFDRRVEARVVPERAFRHAFTGIDVTLENDLQIGRASCRERLRMSDVASRL